jgi:hypothetical protein
VEEQLLLVVGEIALVFMFGLSMGDMGFEICPF